MPITLSIKTQSYGLFIFKNQVKLSRDSALVRDETVSLSVYEGAKPNQLNFDLQPPFYPIIQKILFTKLKL